MHIAFWPVAACLEIVVYASSCSCSRTLLESAETRPVSNAFRPSSERVIVRELSSRAVGVVDTRGRGDAVRRLEVRTFLLVEHLVVRPISFELGRGTPQWMSENWDIDRTIKIGLSALLYEKGARGDRMTVGGREAREDKSILARFTTGVSRYADVSQIPVASLKDALHSLRLLVYDDVDPSDLSTTDVSEALKHESQILKQLMSITSKSFWEAVVRSATMLASLSGPKSFASLSASLPGKVAVPLVSRPNVGLEMALDDYITSREILTDASRDNAEEFLTHLGSAEKQRRFRGATELAFRRIQSLGTSLLGFPPSGGLPTGGHSQVSNTEGQQLQFKQQLLAEVHEQAMRLAWGAKWINELLVFVDPSNDHDQSVIWLSVQEETEFAEFVLDVKARLGDKVSPVDDIFRCQAKPVFAVLMSVARAYGLQPNPEPGKHWWPLLSATLSHGVWRKISNALRLPVDGFRASVQFLNLAHERLAG